MPVHINYTISQYWLGIHQPCDIASPRDRTISCTNARLNTRALLASSDATHKQCGRSR